MSYLQLSASDINWWANATYADPTMLTYDYNNLIQQYDNLLVQTNTPVAEAVTDEMDQFVQYAYQLAEGNPGAIAGVDPTYVPLPYDAGEDDVVDADKSFITDELDSFSSQWSAFYDSPVIASINADDLSFFDAISTQAINQLSTVNYWAQVNLGVTSDDGVMSYYNYGDAINIFAGSEQAIANAIAAIGVSVVNGPNGEFFVDPQSTIDMNSLDNDQVLGTPMMYSSPGTVNINGKSMSNGETRSLTDGEKQALLNYTTLSSTQIDQIRIQAGTPVLGAIASTFNNVVTLNVNPGNHFSAIEDLSNDPTSEALLVHEVMHVAQFSGYTGALGTTAGDILSLVNLGAGQLVTGGNAYSYNLNSIISQGGTFDTQPWEIQAAMTEDLYLMEHNMAPADAVGGHFSSGTLRNFIFPSSPGGIPTH